MTCQTPDCNRPVTAKGLCARCYQRQRRGGGAAKPAEATAQLIVRLPAELRAAAEKCATARGEKLSAWIRRLIEMATTAQDYSPRLPDDKRASLELAAKFWGNR